MHVVNDLDQLGEDLRMVLSDQAYRRHLEVNARAWFERWLAPARVVKRLLGTDSATTK